MPENQITTIEESGDKDRILVVDDDYDDLQALRKAVSSIRDTCVESADDGVQALQTATSFMPDVLITDLDMPGMNGAELIELVDKELYERVGRRPGVIVITGKPYLLEQHEQLLRRAKVIEKNRVDEEVLRNTLESLNGFLALKRENRKLRREVDVLRDQLISDPDEERDYWLTYAPIGFTLLGTIITLSPWLLNFNVHWMIRLTLICGGLIWVVVGLTTLREVHHNVEY